MTKKQTQKQTDDQQTNWEAKAQEYLNGWKRAQADLINSQKDEERRNKELVAFANESLIMEILDVLDNLDLVMRSVPDEVKAQKDWFVGLEQSVKQFTPFLEKHGVKRIAVEGNSFDPMLHEAVPGGDADGDGIEEVRAGYTMHEKVIRAARVRIIKTNN